MAITLRRDKGSALTFDEMDDNFEELSAALSLVYQPLELYPDLPELLAEQPTQLIDSVYYVVDATDDPAVVSRGTTDAYYRYNGAASDGNSGLATVADYTLLPPAIEVSSGGSLEKITEGGNTGYRLKDADTNNYGGIGEGAIDLSTSFSTSSVNGATGDYSFAAGVGNQASGEGATAVGSYNKATGDGAYVSGRNNEASGANTRVSGNNNMATQASATADGTFNNATAQFASVKGSYNTASGEWSSAEGYQNNVSGRTSTVKGEDNVVSGDWSSAEGEDNVVSGDYSKASGLNNTVSGDWSSADGNQNIVSGDYSKAFGLDNEISGLWSSATGDSNEVESDYSTAMGLSNSITGNNSVAKGEGNFARSTGEDVSGLYGTDYTTANDSTDRLKNVGNGTGISDRSDAWSLFKNGAHKFYTAALSTVTNAAKGFLMLDENADLNIHDGTQWNRISKQQTMSTTNRWLLNINQNFIYGDQIYGKNDVYVTSDSTVSNAVDYLNFSDAFMIDRKTGIGKLKSIYLECTRQVNMTSVRFMVGYVMRTDGAVTNTPLTGGTVLYDELIPLSNSGGATGNQFSKIITSDIEDIEVPDGARVICSFAYGVGDGVSLFMNAVNITLKFA